MHDYDHGKSLSFGSRSSSSSDESKANVATGTRARSGRACARSFLANGCSSRIVVVAATSLDEAGRAEPPGGLRGSSCH